MLGHRKLLFLVLLLVIDARCWVINVSDNVVARKFSKNVTIECVYDGNDNNASTLSEIYRIRISKFTDNNQWMTVASVSAIHPTVKSSLFDAVVTGHAGVLSNTFLKVKFPIATQETIGQYKCDLDGYDYLEQIETITTAHVIIKERGINYEDILNIVMELKEEESHQYIEEQLKFTLLQKSISLLESKVDSISQSVVINTNEISDISDKQGLIKSSFANLSSGYDTELKKLEADVADLNQNLQNENGKTGNKVQKLSSELKNEINNIHRTVKTLKVDMVQGYKDALYDMRGVVANDPAKIWPKGLYSMVMPDTGCPHSPSFDWRKGVFRITTRAGTNNDDAVSTPSHFSGDVLEHDSQTSYNYVNLKLCVNDKNVDGPVWPKGTYCIQSYQYSSSSVSGFSQGYVTFDRYNTNSFDEVTDIWNSKNYDITNIAFHCRKDGRATSPIVLPSKQPFYLYRYGGICQEVQDMTVTNEWVYYDTLGIQDKYYTTWHPDGSINKVRLEACYYTHR